MGFWDALDPLLSALPEVKRPDRVPPLKEKLLWTIVILLIFFVLGQIYPLGVDASRLTSFERLDILLGSRMGTLITTGIGPIVLASIFLQLAVGAKLVNLDFSTPDGKKRFQGIQKMLAILLSFFEAGIYVLSGYLPASKTALIFGSFFFTQLFMVFQLALASVILLYLDEVVQKYGIGSGISLFIAAGVSQSVFIGAFSLVPGATGIPAGLIPSAIYSLANGDVVNAIWGLMPVVFTVLVFMVVVYVEGMKIELPLAYGRARGLGARYPIKFMYVSNIPVILASAVILNLQLVGMFTAVPIAGAGNLKAGFLGTYQNNQPVSGFVYYITSLPSPLLVTGGYPAYIQQITQPNEILHMFVYGFVLILLCIVFGWFWIESTGMGAKDVAGQLNRAGLQIPGFRQDPRVTEKILERYIPIITILGSVFVGLLAWFADITGALGTGTGILLTVGIVYRFYEDLAQQQLFEMYPVLNKIMR